MMTRLGEKIRAFFAKGGHTCDGCGREVFDYPNHRLCRDCEGALWRNIDHTCNKCGRKTHTDGVCLACKKDLPQFTKGYSPFVYGGAVASLVNRLKNGDRYLSNALGEEMADYLRPHIDEKENWLVVSVPLTNEREKARGYNQAEELAKCVARRLGLELDSEVLVKTRDVISQKYLSKKERMENAQGAYRVHKRKTVQGRKIILIDDIMTTGATGGECSRVLKNAGAIEVIFLSTASLPERK
jgi:ComF family protein